MPCHRLCNDEGQLLAQLLDLRFQLGILKIATPKLCTRSGEFADEGTDLLPRIVERAFADARGHVPLLFPQLDGVDATVKVPP